MTSLPSLIGTQMKEISSFLSPLRAPVRSRKSGSCEMRGTTTGWPVWTTLPGHAFAEPVAAALLLTRREAVAPLR